MDSVQTHMNAKPTAKPTHTNTCIPQLCSSLPFPLWLIVVINRIRMVLMGCYGGLHPSHVRKICKCSIFSRFKTETGVYLKKKSHVILIFDRSDEISILMCLFRNKRNTSTKHISDFKKSFPHPLNVNKNSCKSSMCVDQSDQCINKAVKTDETF